MNFHQDGTLPAENSVWVFGSNLAGAHGAGAAWVAKKRFGAVYGVGVGPQGMAYAIPTKDHQIQTLPVDAIASFVAEFLDFARANPEARFFVTRIGCGLAGYQDADIAPLFKGAPTNCSLANEWEGFVK